MSKVALDTVAPDFLLTSYDNQQISLSDYKNSNNVLLVFNRGFT
ncbi:MAG: hypothetical protein WBB69_06495 [Anaerolineales bacterium]